MEGWKVQLSLGREQGGTTDHNRDADLNTFKKAWKETGQRELGADHLWVQMWFFNAAGFALIEDDRFSATEPPWIPGKPCSSAYFLLVNNFKSLLDSLLHARSFVADLNLHICVTGGWVSVLLYTNRAFIIWPHDNCYLIFSISRKIPMWISAKKQLTLLKWV